MTDASMTRAQIAEQAETLKDSVPTAAAAIQAALALLDAAEARAARRAFLQRGWTRALVHYTDKQDMADATALRGHLFGILVEERADDLWAAQYQRLHFRHNRCQQSIGAFGLAGRTVVDAHGAYRVPQETIAAENRAEMARIRGRAHAAMARTGERRHPSRVVAAERDQRAHEREQAAMMGYA